MCELPSLKGRPQRLKVRRTAAAHQPNWGRGTALPFVQPQWGCRYGSEFKAWSHGMPDRDVRRYTVQLSMRRRARKKRGVGGGYQAA